MMGYIKELIPHFQPPVLASKKVVLSGVSIIIKNQGDATVTLNSHFTIKPGETLNIGVGNELNTIITGSFNFIFGAGSTPRIEIMELLPGERAFSNYEQA